MLPEEAEEEEAEDDPADAGEGVSNSQEIDCLISKFAPVQSLFDGDPRIYAIVNMHIVTVNLSTKVVGNFDTSKPKSYLEVMQEFHDKTATWSQRATNTKNVKRILTTNDGDWTMAGEQSDKSEAKEERNKGPEQATAAEGSGRERPTFEHARRIKGCKHTQLIEKTCGVHKPTARADD